MPPLNISPPLLNSANPWCTTLAHLRALYRTPHTGAITTRTSLLSPSGFPHDPSVHQFTFFHPSSHTASLPNTDSASDSSSSDASSSSSLGSQTGSLNTLGYSPLPLSTYLSFVKNLSDEFHAPANGDKKGGKGGEAKPIILSVTGTAADIATCYHLLSQCQDTVAMPLAMELNLSCPNIPGSPPPAYSRQELGKYLVAVKRERRRQRRSKQAGSKEVNVGIKTPPYTYSEQFDSLIGALLDSSTNHEDEDEEDGVCPVDFITAVNTLGSSLLLTPSSDSPAAAASSEHTSSTFRPTLSSASGTGIGGMAGAPLHPLALGNVYTIVEMLKGHEVLAHVQVIGVGGVEDTEGYRRMRGVGASAVGVGTALGRKGVGVFEEIGAVGVEEEMRKAVG